MILLFLSYANFHQLIGKKGVETFQENHFMSSCAFQTRGLNWTNHFLLSLQSLLVPVVAVFNVNQALAKLHNSQELGGGTDYSFSNANIATNQHVEKAVPRQNAKGADEYLTSAFSLVKKAFKKRRCSLLVRLDDICAMGLLKLFARTAALLVWVAWLRLALLCVFRNMSG